MHLTLLRAVLLGWGQTSCFLSRGRPCLSPPVQCQSPQELGSHAPMDSPRLSPSAPSPARPRASTRCLGLGPTYSVSRHTHPPGSQTESGETPELGEEAGEDAPSTRTLADDGYFTRTRWVEVAQGQPACCALCVFYFSCTNVENYPKNLLDLFSEDPSQQNFQPDAA